MYNFSYKRFEKLPRLAWLAELNNDTQEISVLCGRFVECFDDYFVAGVWDGNFETANFNDCEIFCGSGAKIIDDGVSFVSPSHSLQRLVVAEEEERIVISNSLPFILSYVGYEPDKKIDQYERILCSVLDGPQDMIAHIPMSEGKSIQQVIVSSIDIDTTHNPKIVPRAKQKSFSNFFDFYSRLMSSMVVLRSNSIDQNRKQHQYGIVTTLSSGYDSSVCALIARKLGCDTSVSLSGGEYDIDSGIEVAQTLGYSNIVFRDRHLYRKKKGNIDARFLADGEMATAMQFTVFEDLFENNIVFMGLRGSYWDKNPTMTEGFQMIGYFNNEADISFTEDALENGYIIIPVPTFGASACNSIFKISKSDEMKPWSIGGDYDKPIPRRILEMNGICRESFGQKKYGGGFSLYRDNRSRLSKRMTEEGFQSFAQFLDDGNGIPWSYQRKTRLIKYIILNFPTYLNYCFGKLKLPRIFKQKAVRIAKPGIGANLFFWAISAMKKRYLFGMNEEKPAK